LQISTVGSFRNLPEGFVVEIFSSPDVQGKNMQSSLVPLALLIQKWCPSKFFLRRIVFYSIVPNSFV